MHVPTTDEWAAMWACPELWATYWRGVQQDVTSDDWATFCLPFLRSCALARSSGQAGGRVFMHRALRLWASPGSSRPVGHRTFVLVAEDGRCRMATTKQDINVIGAYVAALAQRTSCTVYEILPNPRDLEYSTSTVANKPVAAQLSFTRGRSTSAGGLI